MRQLAITIPDDLAEALAENPLPLPLGEYCLGALLEAQTRAAERRSLDAALVALLTAARSDENHSVLSKNQAAEHLGVSLNTVHRMIGDGRLPAVKVGRAVRIPYVAVAALALNRRQQPE